MIQKLRHHAAKLHHAAPHLEHVGFVAYAGCEVVGLHALIYVVSAYLFVTGLWVMLVVDVHISRREAEAEAANQSNEGAE